MNMPRRDFRRSIIWIVGYAAFLALLFFIIAKSGKVNNSESLPYEYQPWIIGTSNPSGEFEETFTVPINSKTDILSKREYGGLVSIIIRGEGQLDSKFKHDAFYAYESTNDTKNALNSLFIDNREYPFEFFVERAQYNSKHEYGILYPVGQKLRPIHFRVVNNNSEDTSRFTVIVSTRNIVGGEGR